MAIRHAGMLIGMVLLACACSRGPSEGAEEGSASPPQQSQPAAAVDADAAPMTAGDREFPAIPQIVVPDIVGIGPAQQTLESAMQDILDPIAGISVRPANCSADGALVNDAGITSVDADGKLSRNGDEGIFRIAADGSGTANFGGGIVTVDADGSGSINGSGEDGADDAIVTVGADGSGSYNGKYGIIRLDGKGAGTWNHDDGVITNNGDGSGTWNGPQGVVTINADGSGSWNSPQGLVINDGDGNGRIGAPAREMKMAPIPKVAPAGKFPPLKKFAPPGAPCGFVITLNDRVLFDFDQAQIRPDAVPVLDTLAAALQKVPARAMEIRGHTDAKGSDDYNLDLSERRAQAVVAALRQRGAAQDAQAKGYGESQPVAPNELNGQDNPAGRQLNRRVELFVRT